MDKPNQKARRRASASVQSRARQLRREQTDAEAKLWSYLRNRQLDGFKFRRQHPIGRFIVDFCCVDRRLIVELDGEVHTSQAAEDQARAEALQAAGYTIARWSNDQIEHRIANVLSEIRRLLTDSPAPAAAGEGVRASPTASSLIPPLLPQRERGLGGEGLPHSIQYDPEYIRTLRWCHKHAVRSGLRTPANDRGNRHAAGQQNLP